MTRKTVHDGREMWEYGSAGDEYPVTDRDIWQCGKHVLACGDIHVGAWHDLVERIDRPDIVYTDPPWSAGNEKAFRTKAGLDNSDADFEALIRSIVRPVSNCPHLFLQAGDENVDDVAKWVHEEHAADGHARWPIKYYDENPCWLLYSGVFDEFNAGLGGRDDTETPRLALQAVTRQSPAKLVADPCTGNDGLTAKAAVETSCRFVGLELHPRRLANVVKWFDENGQTPQRTGEMTASK